MGRFTDAATLAPPLPRANDFMELNSDTATQAWDEVLARVEAFVLAWDEKRAEIDDFLRPEDAPAIRRLVLQELIKIDMEYRLAFQGNVRLESYLQRYPELGRDGPLGALIYEEFHLRKAHGHDARVEEYVERFPDQSSVISKLLKINEPTLSTSLRHSAPRLDLNSGQQFDDFDLLVKLGAGAFGAVFLARQRSMQRLVALKVTADQGTEPQTLAQLDHPHIVRVYDQRELTEERLWLMYMEFLPGGTLDHVCTLQKSRPEELWNGQLLLEAVDAALLHAGQAPLETQRRQGLRKASWAEVVSRLGAELGEALAYAHQHTLHRDIKPANVLLSADASPKLADFNTSYCSRLEGAKPASYFGGSLPYMSPEQLKAFNPRCESITPDQLDGRSDLYSLAVMLWELLVGARPFGRESLSGDIFRDLEAMTQLREQGPPDPETLADPLARATARTLAECLHPDLQQRTSDGRELATRLRLGLNPTAMRVYNAPERGAGRWLAAAPFAWVLAAVFLPNALTALLNLWYNRSAIVMELQSEHGALSVFDRTQGIINGIAFPLGIAIIIALCLPVRRALARPDDDARAGGGASPSWNRLARRSLMLGHIGALVGVSEWAIAGLAYPIAMHAALGFFPATGYLLFSASLVFCGLIAAAYPFFAATSVVMNSIYPLLWRRSRQSGEPWDPRQSLLSLKKLSYIYLLVAAGAPLLALLVLAPITLWMREHATDKLALLLLIVAGAIGLVVSFVAHRALQRDIDALLDHHGEDDAHERH